MQDETPTLRRATVQDAAPLAAFALRSFSDTYAVHNDAALMAAYTDKAFSVETLQQELDDPANIFILACIGDQIAGYTKLRVGKNPDCLKANRSIEVERLYADKKWHGRGVGKILMDANIEYAAEHDYGSLWLGVWRQNHRAVRFYEKSGFSAVGTHIFMMADDPQEDWVMEKLIESPKV
ncbi:GNAT family N-acetyltransferase [Kordiimonas sediminis]|uniref:GNAT family N-acetyltransferase n=1 Tax=Kordiimonas sediminis TaxID=1735581 RepID=UPI00174DE17B|nr:GNAT family N-acetyltransferase [Kordiimonas sediminis]